MKSRKLVVMMLIALLMVGVWPAQAQEGEDLLGIVTTAFGNLNALQGYQAVTEQEQTQTLNSGEGYLTVAANQEVEQTITTQVRPAQEGQTEASSIVLEQRNSVFVDDTTDNVNPERHNFTIEVIQLDGQVYVRIPTEAEGLFPAIDWVNITENPAALPLVESFNLEAMTSLTGISGALFNPDTVTDIQEGANEGISGQVMRVFTLTMNPMALFTGVNGATLAGLEDGDDPVVQAVLGAMTVQYIVWVGADDNLPHRMQAIIAVDIELGEDLTAGDPVKLVINSDATTDYSAFDTPVDIQIPSPEPTVEEGETTEEGEEEPATN